MFELISRVPSRYYLAYGSNLDMERMGKRCPYAVVVGTTEIKGYRLLFKKSKTGCYATIEQDANESVPAVVWKLSEYDELLLDRYEGCQRYYYKKQFQLPVWNLNGNRMKKAKPCIAYVMHEGTDKIIKICLTGVVISIGEDLHVLGLALGFDLLSLGIGL